MNDNLLDGVISWGVVEHDEMGVDVVFEELGRIILTRGFAIITVPNDDSNPRVMSAHQHPRLNNSQFLQYYFNETVISKVGTANSFELVEWSKTGTAAFAKWSPRTYDIFKRNTMALRALLFIFSIFDRKKQSFLESYVFGKIKKKGVSNYEIKRN